MLTAELKEKQKERIRELLEEVSPKELINVILAIIIVRAIFGQDN